MVDKNESCTRDYAGRLLRIQTENDRISSARMIGSVISSLTDMLPQTEKYNL